MDGLAILFAGYLFGIGACIAYWCLKTIKDLTPEVIDAIVFWYWRWKRKSDDEK